MRLRELDPLIPDASADDLLRAEAAASNCSVLEPAGFALDATSAGFLGLVDGGRTLYAANNTRWSA